MLAALLACSPCTAFADMVLPPELVPVVEEFATWTGEEGVCVPRVDIVPVIAEDDRISGRYQGPGEPILLAEAEPVSYEITLTHELCHALDHELDLSADLEPWLDVAGVEADAYPTKEQRVEEAFALACEQGPEIATFEAMVADTCGTFRDPAPTLVRAAAFPGAPPDPTVRAGTLTSWGELPARVTDAASGGTGVWLDASDRAPWWWSPDAGGVEPIGTWSGDTGEATSVDGAALRGWYEHGISGFVAEQSDAWVVATDCSLGLSGAVPAWVGDTPLVFTDRSPSAVYAW
jgi:hypothetical protein